MRNDVRIEVSHFQVFVLDEKWGCRWRNPNILGVRVLSCSSFEEESLSKLSGTSMGAGAFGGYFRHSCLPGLSITLKKWGHCPKSWGHDPFFQGSRRL